MGSVASSRSSKRPQTKDHVNEFGFVNDGYDYSKHFRDAEGGTLYGGGELAQTLLRAKHMDLPEEVFAAGEIDRNELQHAITISSACMDADLHAALFDDVDETGEGFEELDDDFVAQAMAPLETPDFDFEAHMAKLLAMSANSLGIPKSKARGWDDAEGKQLLEALNEEDEEFDEDNEDLSWGTDEDEDGEGHDGDANDEEFEQLMREYEEDDDDYDEEEEADNEGEIDITLEAMALTAGEDEDGEGESEVVDTAEKAEKHLQRAFHAALDEFLVEQKAYDYIAPLPKVVYKTKEFADDSNDSESNGENSSKTVSSTAAMDPAQIKAMYSEQAVLQAHWAEEVALLDEAAKIAVKEIPHCQEYLRQEKVREEWDCESILSTYSTTDNLPTVLGDGRSNGGRHRKARFAAHNAPGTLSSVSAMLSAAPPASFMHSNGNSNGISRSIQQGAAGAQQKSGAPPKILLSGRLNLPEGFAPREIRQQQQQQQQQLHIKQQLHSSASSVTSTSSMFLSSTTNTVPAVDNKKTKSSSASKSQSNSDTKKKKGLDKVDEDSEEEEEEDSEEDDEGDAKDTSVRRRGRETAEERKARKAQLKEERRRKRGSKKQLKETFKQESGKVSRALGKEGASTEGVSVFRYSA